MPPVEAFGVHGVSEPSNSSVNCRRHRKLRKHIPHSLRPTDFVIRRNQRERKRVDAVNKAFNDLKEMLPLVQGSGKVSKMAILRHASLYIQFLSRSLRVDGLGCSEPRSCSSDYLVNNLNSIDMFTTQHQSVQLCVKTSSQQHHSRVMEGRHPSDDEVQEGQAVSVAHVRREDQSVSNCVEDMAEWIMGSVNEEISRTFVYTNSGQWNYHNHNG